MALCTKAVCVQTPYGPMLGSPNKAISRSKDRRFVRTMPCALCKTQDILTLPDTQVPVKFAQRSRRRAFLLARRLQSRAEIGPLISAAGLCSRRADFALTRF